MTYNPEKYRNKREKVLGIKKRGISFGTVSALVSLVILAGTGLVVVPGAFSYLQTRHLDDAIFKLPAGSTWTADVTESIDQMGGVDQAVADKSGTRLVITFDRRTLSAEAFREVFRDHDLEAVLLNTVNHRQRELILEQEEET